MDDHSDDTQAVDGHSSIQAAPTGQILAAWIAKEELRKLLATAKTGGTRHDVAHRPFRLHSW